MSKLLESALSAAGDANHSTLNIKCSQQFVSTDEYFEGTVKGKEVVGNAVYFLGDAD